MVQRIGGFRRKTRGKLTKQNKGRIVIRNFLQTFDVDEKVGLRLDPAHQKGMFHPRFQGKTAIVKGKEGNCYKIELIDGHKAKYSMVHPIHLKKLK